MGTLRNGAKSSWLRLPSIVGLVRLCFLLHVASAVELEVKKPDPISFVYNRAAIGLCNASWNAHPVHLFSLTEGGPPSLIAVGMSDCQERDVVGDWALPAVGSDCSTSAIIGRSSDGGVTWACEDAPTLPSAVLRTSASIVAGRFYEPNLGNWTVMCVAGGEYLDPQLRNTTIGAFSGTDSVMCTSDIGKTWFQAAPLPFKARRGTFALTSGQGALYIGGEREDNSTDLWFALIDSTNGNLTYWFYPPGATDFGPRLYPIVHSQLSGINTERLTQRIIVGGGVRIETIPANASSSSSSNDSTSVAVPLDDLWVCDPCDYLSDFVPSTLPADDTVGLHALALAGTAGTDPTKNASGSAAAALIVGWGGADVYNTTFDSHCNIADDPAFKCLVLFRGRRTYWSPSRRNTTIEWLPLNLVMATAPSNESAAAASRTAPPLLTTAPAILRPTEARDPAGLGFVAALSPTDARVVGFTPHACRATCPDGQFSFGCDAAPDQYTCQPCKRCTPGVTYASQACFQANSFTGPYGGDTVCSACTRCKPGLEVAVSRCSETSDAVCRPVDEVYASQACAASAAGFLAGAPILGCVVAAALWAVAVSVTVSNAPSAGQRKIGASKLEWGSGSGNGSGSVGGQPVSDRGVISRLMHSWPVHSSALWAVANCWSIGLLLLISASCSTSEAVVLGSVKVPALLASAALGIYGMRRMGTVSLPGGRTLALHSPPSVQLGLNNSRLSLSLLGGLHPRAAYCTARDARYSSDEVRWRTLTSLAALVIAELPCLLADGAAAVIYGGGTESSAVWSAAAAIRGDSNWLLVCIVCGLLLNLLFMFYSIAEIAAGVHFHVAAQASKSSIPIHPHILVKASLAADTIAAATRSALHDQPLSGQVSSDGAAASLHRSQILYKFDSSSNSRSHAGSALEEFASSVASRDPYQPRPSPRPRPPLASTSLSTSSCYPATADVVASNPILYVAPVPFPGSDAAVDDTNVVAATRAFDVTPDLGTSAASAVVVVGGGGGSRMLMAAASGAPLRDSRAGRTSSMLLPTATPRTAHVGVPFAAAAATPAAVSTGAASVQSPAVDRYQYAVTRNPLRDLNAAPWLQQQQLVVPISSGILQHQPAPHRLAAAAAAAAASFDGSSEIDADGGGSRSGASDATGESGYDYAAQLAAHLAALDEATAAMAAANRAAEEHTSSHEDSASSVGAPASPRGGVGIGGTGALRPHPARHARGRVPSHDHSASDGYRPPSEAEGCGGSNPADDEA